LALKALFAIKAAVIIACEVRGSQVGPRQGPQFVETFQSLSDFLPTLSAETRAVRGDWWHRYTTLKRKASKSKGCMKNSRRGRNHLCGLFLVVMATLIAETTVVWAENDQSVKRVAEITDELRQELGIQQAVDVQIVPSNSLAFSVEAVDRHTHFTISVDASFLRQLNDQELTAALAHELGHVWIYTHRPFLHTEGLANEIALRVISEDSLRSLYGKLQQFESSRSDHGNLPGVLNSAAR
jgi:hypothetical protein